MGRTVNLPSGAGERFTGSPARAGSVYLHSGSSLWVSEYNNCGILMERQEMMENDLD